MREIKFRLVEVEKKPASKNDNRIYKSKYVDCRDIQKVYYEKNKERILKKEREREGKAS